MGLLDESILKSLPPLYACEKEEDPLVLVKLFTPDSNWSWYIMEYDAVERVAFGYVCGLEKELGYFSLDELEALRGPLGLAVERDVSFTAMRVSEIKC